ncbi:cobalamin biosynthesis protein [Tsukamurella sp. 8F]|uniref:cobalamin biosynthesis protein n=1 Tax=unclassified Tsukamurella TaxID=2633480 RepID=UPI0023B9F2BE|nr:MULTISPECIES: cobalamin biosynthesis protein [unclassified Tsukamurella]MDF0529961.1 cobalamin biosynthesis protein [Tsukamurella sp. 8J]MDF0587267.1 cobalamin biosynthesis protein [Tsukamurella sp. 8F]
MKVLELAAGVAADEMFGDPRRYHPVAGFGAIAARLETVLYRDSKAAGVVYTAALIGGVAAVGYAFRRVPGATAAGAWVALGGAGLRAVGADLGSRLSNGDVDGARDLLPSLCGRDPSVLDEAGLARAALESVAENTSDAAVAPLFWGAVLGLPGLLVYRAINTLDAMVGYRNDRYREFGWASARLDDLANYVPARLAGFLTVAVAPVVGGAPSSAWRAWRRDARKHPSPNAGVAEASAAGALGLRLGGRTQYRHGVEMRPELGEGRAPAPSDLRRAARLSLATELAALAALAVVSPFARSGRRAGRRVPPRA